MLFRSNAYNFYSYSGTARALIMGVSTFNLSNQWYVTSSGLTLNAGTSTISFGSGMANFNGGGFTYYDISLGGTGGGMFAAINDNNTFHDAFIGVDININGTNTFNNVTLTKNGNINGSNTFNNLTFSPGFTYTLQAGQIQTINTDRKSTRLNSSHIQKSRMPSSA